ncbi:MAG TPA: dihydrofolate synthase, partial [Dehalococcoidia bacterium]|nr:dihydrofolate synthase [Dehalococcoidia bacterium]
MNYREAIDYLLSLSDLERGIQKSANPTMSLGAIRSLFKRLGNPQHGRSTVHVTGSKGKGSTATMIESILCAARKRTALFTSPHLHSYRERIRFNGIPVSEQEFASALETVLPALGLESQQVGADLSTFGILTAMFFASVSNRSPAVDCQIVEVGLGGSFDATNVFEKVDVAVITPIALEHTAIVGDSESEIARDKVGIVKDGSTFVLTRQE